MYKIESIEIDGFWGEYYASSNFRSDVNIIIGKNGTGKTTFMNIMHAVLSVDVDALYENFFKNITINLINGARRRKISAERKNISDSSVIIIEYKISNSKFSLPLFGGEEIRNLSPSLRRRAAEDAREIKNNLKELVSLASLSVYRLGGDFDPESRERPQRRHISPVDQRLASLTQSLTQYQLELSTEARKISSDLQREVLTSLLYVADKKTQNRYPVDFDVDAERKKLISTYNQLGVSGAEINKKIQHHVLEISKAYAQLDEYSKTKKMPESGINFGAIEAFSRTGEVVDLSLNAENKINEIFSQRRFFIDLLQKFIPDKVFNFDAGELVVGKKGVSIEKLSSGEKQLLILFIESLLQRRRPYIFLADEPELSLHISWQRNIISAIMQINPAAQIIVATHSPEIAGKFRNAILDMEDIRRA